MKPAFNQRVPDPEFRSMAAGFFNRLPSLTFWETLDDMSRGCSITYNYDIMTFSWDDDDDVPPAGFVLFELFEDRELVAAQDFVSIVRTAIAAEAKGNREQVQKGEQILERIAARLNCS